MTTPRDALLRQSAAMEYVQDLAHAHGFDGDADEQQAIFMALLAYAGEERDALCAALVQEYADVLAQRGSWRWPGSHTTVPEALPLPYLRGARDALLSLATRLGVDDLIARAADVVARGDDHGNH